MTVPAIYVVTVSGVDVTAYTTDAEIEREFLNEIGIARITVNTSVSAVLEITETNIGDAVTITRGPTTGAETVVFKGTVNTVNPAGPVIILECNDQMYNARLRTVTKSFDQNIDTEAGVISEIFKTLVNDFTDLTADSSSITDSGTTNILSKFVCNNAEVFERLSELAETLDWQFYYDPDTDKVYFQPKGTLNNGVSLNVGTTVVNVPTWTFDSEQLANKVTVIGAEQEVETTENFDGTGAQTEFTLANTPVSVKVFVGGVLQTGGNQGTSSPFDYSVDDINKKIIFEAGSVPPSGSGNVVIDYSYFLPVPVVGANNTSIATYGTFEKTIFKLEIKDRDDAQEFLANYLATYGVPFVSSKLNMIDAQEVSPGESIAVTDSINSVNRTVLISKMVMKYPYTNDELTVGDKLLKTNDWMADTEDRIRRLEEQQASSQDLLLHVLDQFRLEVTYERRYVKVGRRSIAGDALIWDNLQFGNWDDEEWGADDSGAFVLGNSENGVLGEDTLGGTLVPFTITRIIPGKCDFKEYFYDEEFVDTANSTATVNTADKRVEL